MHHRFPLNLAFLALMLLVTLAACGGEESATIDEDVPVADILQNASERLAETESMRFGMEVDGDTYIDDSRTMRLLNAKGTMARPDRVDVQFQIEALGAQTISVRMITIGEDAWTTDIVTGRWVTAPTEFGYNPSILYDNQDGLGPVMGKIENAEIVDVEEIDGRQAYHISGTSPNEVMSPITSGTMGGENIAIDMWIDGETWDLLRVVVGEPDDSGSDNPATWTMTLTRHNDEVSIAPPT